MSFIRFCCDPPEFLSFGWGGSYGLHFGLWFHDAQRYAGVVANYARDSAETWFCDLRTLEVEVGQGEDAHDRIVVVDHRSGGA